MPTRLKTRMIATLISREVQQHAEVERDDDADEELEDQQELALLDEVGLAGLVDQLGDLEHRLVDRQVLQLRVRSRRPNSRPERETTRPPRSSVWPSMPLERHRAEVGQHEVGLAAHVRGLRRRRRWRTLRRKGRAGAHKQRRRPTRPATLHAFLSPCSCSPVSRSPLDVLALGRWAPQRNHESVTYRGSGSRGRRAA